ncbi:MAG: anaerobic ribonucleoside-triphosphate reductase [archaeon]
MTEEKNKDRKEPEPSASLGTCPNCGSHKIEMMTRVTGFFSKVNSWNKGKIGELKKRREAIKANQSHIQTM